MNCELTKTIEATKLNKRTLRPLGAHPVTIPYGAMLEDVTVDRDQRRRLFSCRPPVVPGHGKRHLPPHYCPQHPVTVSPFRPPHLHGPFVCHIVDGAAPQLV